MKLERSDHRPLSCFGNIENNWICWPIKMNHSSPDLVKFKFPLSYKQQLKTCWKGNADDYENVWTQSRALGKKKMNKRSRFLSIWCRKKEVLGSDWRRELKIVICYRIIISSLALKRSNHNLQIIFPFPSFLVVILPPPKKNKLLFSSESIVKKWFLRSFHI